jgi:catechol 2,3-dioxygenase-like lactoylglutathione lyase family enzyme
MFAGAKPSVYILGFSTSNYDAMLKFFRDFGFTVAEDPHDQLTPFFEHGRAAHITRGSLEFQLEESESRSARAFFNLFLTDFSDEEIERVKALGYECEHQAGLYGESHSFRSPDGGTLVVM